MLLIFTNVTVLLLLLQIHTALFCIAQSITAADVTAVAADDFSIDIDCIVVDIGENIGSHVRDRITKHFNSVRALIVETIDSTSSKTSLRDSSACTREAVDERRFHLNRSDIAAAGAVNILVLSIGDTNLFDYLSNEKDFDDLPPESFHMQCVNLTDSSYGEVLPENYVLYGLAVNGKPLDLDRHQNVSFSKMAVHYGAVVGAYAALEYLGFAFLHPLEPYIPMHLTIKTLSQRYGRYQDSYGPLPHMVTESPYWPERGFHIHTQHPLELTEVLQGHDIPQFGPHGPECKRFRKQKPPNGQRSTVDSNSQNTNYCERWEDMVIDVDYMFEWAVANRQNKIEWLLLGNYKWGDERDTRLKRLRVLTDLGHRYSLMVGADSPIGNIQQHGWNMVNVRSPFSTQIEQIHAQVDWIFNAGFDFLSTESGLSEFTHPECDLMIDLMNTFARHVNVTWGREAAIKVHCSTGQKCASFPDPRTNEPINFNFLTAYAHPGLGIYSHTVQVYALDDPTAGAYGNDNFSYVEDYMVYEAKRGHRSVSFYGETAYWVNVDVDVPLFLPIYGQRRQHDLRRMALREQKEGFRIDGQMNFDSGWEWGYWLSDVVTARAAWNPMVPILLNQTDVYEARTDEWDAFAAALLPFTSIFGSSLGPRINNLLVRLSQLQVEHLILGRVNGSDSPDLRKLSGMAYMSGGDTWVDIPRLFGVPFTQPDKIHLRESSDPHFAHVHTLLSAIVTGFSDIDNDMKTLSTEAHVSSLNSDIDNGMKTLSTEAHVSSLNDAALNLLDEITDCVHMLVMRAKQQQLLYQSRSPTASALQRAELLRAAREIVHNAEDIVVRRENNYRIPWQRVGEWRENPTVYRFGYLWAVHTLYYWWRDQGLAEQGSFQSEHSPCYLNRMDASEVAMGWGKSTYEMIRTFINRYTPFSAGYPLEMINCLSPPANGYEFPKDLYHFD